MALSLCIGFSNQVLAASEPEAQTEATEGITDDEALQIALDAATGEILKQQVID